MKIFKKMQNTKSKFEKKDNTTTTKKNRNQNKNKIEKCNVTIDPN